MSSRSFDRSLFSSQRSGVFERSTSSGKDLFGTSFRSTARSGGSPANTSVIEAFRELQAEVKALEAERFEALREKEELRNRILEGKRTMSLTKHRLDLEATEKDLQAKAYHDRLQRECEEVRMTMIAKEEIYDSLQRKLQAQQHLQQSLQDDIRRCEQKLVSMEKTSQLLRRELKEITSRASNVEHVIVSSPEVHHSKTNRIEHTIDTLQSQIEKINVSKMKAQAKISSQKSYIDLILKINGELCETLLAREAAKREVMRLTRALTPPRYTWPKEVPYHDILHAVNESAKWTAEAAVERAALKATESALTDVIRAISPPKSRSRSRSRSQSQSARKTTKDNSSPFQQSRSYLDDDDSEDDLEDVRRGRSINRSLKFSSSHISDKKNTKSSNFHSDSYLARDDEASDVSSEARDEENDETVGRYHKYQQSLQDLLRTDVTKSKSKKKTKKVKKRTKKLLSSGSIDSEDFGSITRKNTAGNASTLDQFLSDLRRKKSLQTVIARQAAVTHATRLAAAASAASNTVKIANTNNSASSLHRNTTASLHNRKHRDTDLNVNKVAFVPSSTTGSNEFNIVASVSRAARATKELNATVASRVKSLHSGGVGDIFEEVPRVTLSDLQNQLKAVKTLRKSFEG